MSFNRPRKPIAIREAPPPGRITKISPQRDDPDRVSVFLDDQFAFGLPATAVIDERLTTGDELNAGQIERLLTIDELSRAVNAGLAFLGYRSRSGREVRDRLRLKGYGPIAIDHAIDKLAGWGYLNDADFARRWVEQRVEHHPRGRRLVEQELLHKGIDRETAREVVSDVAFDEQAAANDMAVDRLRRLAGEDPVTAKRRVAGFLARRGYGSSTIRAALEAASDGSMDIELAEGE